MDKLKIIRKFLLKNRVINAKDAANILGHRMAIYRLEKKGIVEKISIDNLGLFTLPKIDEFEASFAAIKLYFPGCVISGRTALSLYELGLDYIDKIDVDIPNNTTLRNSLLEVHRVSYEKINHVIEKSFEEKGIPFKIKIYSPERVLFEGYKYYGKTDAFFRTIKRFRSKYLDVTFPAKQYQIIKSIDKKIGNEIVQFIIMDDIHE